MASNEADQCSPLKTAWFSPFRRPYSVSNDGECLVLVLGNIKKRIEGFEKCLSCLVNILVAAFHKESEVEIGKSVEEA